MELRQKPQEILSELATKSTILLAKTQMTEALLSFKTTNSDHVFIDACQKTMLKYHWNKKVVNTIENEITYWNWNFPKVLNFREVELNY